MKQDFIIKSLTDVQKVAQSYGIKCSITVNPTTKGFGERDDGSRVVRMIVGFKKNPIYDPNNTSGNAAASLPRIPDIKILAIKAGMTAEQLIDRYLKGIKKYVDHSEEVPAQMEAQAPDPKLPTDFELAEALEDGKTQVAGEEAWDDLDKWEDGDVPGDDTEYDLPDVPAQDNSEVLKAIGVMSGKMDTVDLNLKSLHTDVQNINSRLKKVEVEKLDTALENELKKSEMKTETKKETKAKGAKPNKK